jgi:hypothetical protein
VVNFLKLLLLRYFPNFSKAAFRKKRWMEDQRYWSSASSGDSVCVTSVGYFKCPRLLVILPPMKESMSEFGPGAGNYFYEIFQSAQERYGSENVAPHFICRETAWEDECRKISKRITLENFSHMLFYLESKESTSNLWRWDILGSELVKGKSRVIAIGFLTDGTYELHQLLCSRFQELYYNSIFLQIDVTPSDKYVKNGRLFGPTFLPISQESIQYIRDYLNCSKDTKSFELSFIGKIYGYRKKIIRELNKSGVNVSVNPHRSANSDCNPSYLEYMNALSSSKYTINFAKANGTSQMQLKSRMLESALVGTVPLTDDNGLSELVLPVGIPYIRFSNPSEILNITELTMGSFNNEAIEKLQVSEAMETIDRFASNHFWECLEQGLLQANLQILVRVPLEPEN